MIREGKIVEVDANIQGGNLSGTNVIDLTESETILPGMIDLHAHYNFDFIDEGRAEEVVNNGIIFFTSQKVAQRNVWGLIHSLSKRLDN